MKEGGRRGDFVKGERLGNSLQTVGGGGEDSTETKGFEGVKTSAVGVDTDFSRGEGDYQGTLGGEEGLARVALIHLSAYTKTRIWSLYLLRPESCSLQLLSRPAEKYTSRNLASVHKAPKSYTRVKVKILC